MCAAVMKREKGRKAKKRKHRKEWEGGQEENSRVEIHFLDIFLRNSRGKGDQLFVILRNTHSKIRRRGGV